jgi:hypothetical protein
VVVAGEVLALRFEHREHLRRVLHGGKGTMPADDRVRHRRRGLSQAFHS